MSGHARAGTPSDIGQDIRHSPGDAPHTHAPTFPYLAPLKDASVRLRHWVKAARPLAQANIAGPLLLGQGWAAASTGRFSWTVLAWVAAFGIADQLFIVFANDYADQNHDSDQRTLFSGGSGVLQSGVISAAALRNAALLMAIATLCVGAVLSTYSAWALPLSASALVLLWAYSYPPLRLSFRGHGEWLQGLGVGAVLPLMGFATQAGGLSEFPFELLLGTIVLATAGNVATSLPDHAADRRAKKATWAGASRRRTSSLGLPWTHSARALSARLARPGALRRWLGRHRCTPTSAPAAQDSPHPPADLPLCIAPGRLHPSGDDRLGTLAAPRRALSARVARSHKKTSFQRGTKCATVSCGLSLRSWDASRVDRCTAARADLSRRGATCGKNTQAICNEEKARRKKSGAGRCTTSVWRCAGSAPCFRPTERFASCPAAR